MSASIKDILDPFNIFWLLLLIGSGCYFLKKEKLSKIIFLYATCWFFVTSNYLLPNALISNLENKYQPLLGKENFSNIKDLTSYNIVVLGAGFKYDENISSSNQLSEIALIRLIEAIRLHKLLPNSKLILSGPKADRGTITQAEVYKRAALSLGVDSSSIYLQSMATNTYEEAKDYSEVFGKSSPVILVTSASHMQRAIMMFNHFDIYPTPAPTGFQIKGNLPRHFSLMPSPVNMLNMRVALIEYVGIFYAKTFLF